MIDLTINSIAALPDDGATKVATVASSWGGLQVRYAYSTEHGSESSLQFLNADLSQLTPPDDVPARVAGTQWVAAVAAALLAVRTA